MDVIQSMKPGCSLVWQEGRRQQAQWKQYILMGWKEAAHSEGSWAVKWGPGEAVQLSVEAFKT